MGFLRKETDRHIFNQYVVRVSHRDELQVYLQKKGVGTEIYYPVPMHLQECFANLGYESGRFPETERAANQTLALPIHPELTEEQAQFVVACISEFFQQHLARARVDHLETAEASFGAASPANYGARSDSHPHLTDMDEAVAVAASREK